MKAESGKRKAELEIERLRRQRNAAWRALAIINRQWQRDEPIVEIMDYAVNVLPRPEDREEFAAVTADDAED